MPWTTQPPAGTALDPAAGLVTGLEGLWPLNDGSGLPVDAVSGAPWSVCAMPWAEDPSRGRCLRGLGTGLGSYGRVSVPDGSALDLAGTSLAFGAWVKPAAVGGFQLVMGKIQASDVRQYGLYLAQGSTSRLYVALNGVSGLGGTGGSMIAVSPGWVVGAWNLVLLTYDGAQVVVYLNGVAAFSAAATGAAVGVPGSDLYFGEDHPHVTGGDTYGLGGLLGLPGAWSRSLSAGEVASYYGDSWRAFVPPAAPRRRPRWCPPNPRRRHR